MGLERVGLYGRPVLGCDRIPSTWKHREQDAGDHKGLVSAHAVISLVRKRTRNVGTSRRIHANFQWSNSTVALPPSQVKLVVL